MTGTAREAGTEREATPLDAMYMARALELAARGLYTTDPNPRVGCVLVRDGRILGEGWHEKAGDSHAEVLALRAAGNDARGAVAYVTLEPCNHTGRTPPCVDALIAAGIARVICASPDPNRAVAGGGMGRLTAAGIPVTCGLLADQARALNPGFFSRFERGRPFVRLKMAMSLDARTAAAAGGARWITGESARVDVQTWRARSSAILTGAGTIRADDPRLDVRLAYGPWVRQPLRVVLDTNLTCAATSKVFRDDGALVFAAEEATPRAAITPGPGIRIERVPRSARGLSLDAILARLTTLEISELMVEGGARLAAAFLEADRVDELLLYVAPHFLGTDAAPLAAFGGLAAREAASFEFREQRLIGSDLRLLLTPRRT